MRVMEKKIKSDSSNSIVNSIRISSSGGGGGSNNDGSNSGGSSGGGGNGGGSNGGGGNGGGGNGDETGSFLLIKNVCTGVNCCKRK